MAASQSNLKEVVKLTSAQYQELITAGSYTEPVSGITVTYKDDALYCTPDDGTPTGLNSNIVVVSDGNGNAISSGVSTNELNALNNIRSNIQQQIDNLAAQIGIGDAGIYFLDSPAELPAHRDQPGTYYIENPDGTYLQYLISSDGVITLVDFAVPPEDVGQRDLSAYQKKADPSLLVVDKNTGAYVGTVVGSINTLDKEIGQAYPLDTRAQTITEAINELANRAGDVDIVGQNGITITTNATTGTTYVGHTVNGTTTAKTYGTILNTGHVQLPLINTDAYGHTTIASTLRDFYIPTTGAASGGQVWTWDAVNNRGTWTTVTAGGSYTAANGITISGTTIMHTNSGKSAAYGNITDALRMVIDDQGHLVSAARPIGTTGQYIDSNWQWATPKSTATEILNGTTPEKLVNAAAIDDIMDHMRLKKLTQAQYDALTIKDPQTVYIIVG